MSDVTRIRNAIERGDAQAAEWKRKLTELDKAAAAQP